LVEKARLKEMNLSLPFVGRKKEIAQLGQLHAQRKHVLILGPADVGKSAFVAHFREWQSFILCPESETLGGICDRLETGLNSPAPRLPLVRRKNRLIKMLAEIHQTVVFDGVGWTTPKVSSFLESVMERVPIWICARSELALDIGHFWPLLARFESVELRPFHPKETQKLVEAAVAKNLVSEKSLEIVGQLHRRAEGNPKILCELLTEIAHSHYDLSHPHSLRLLELDRRIHEIFPTKA
jgi:hypothetical protein